MKIVLALILSMGTAIFAAEPQSQSVKTSPTEPKPDEVKKLATVTWDLDSHKLVWVVQKGTMVNGEFKAASEQRYEITPDDAVMATLTERRGFDDDEAASLRKLLDFLSLYCAESVVWWEQGEGKPLNGPSTAPAPTTKPTRQADPEPVKVKVADRQPKTPAKTQDVLPLVRIQAQP